MSTTTMSNSSPKARKSLADQLDRLDSVLDGLADNLNEAVASAVKAAVNDVLAELISSAEVAGLVRSMANQGQPEPSRSSGHEEPKGRHGGRTGLMARIWERTNWAVRAVGAGIGLGALLLTYQCKTLIQKTWSGLGWLWEKTKGVSQNATKLITRPVLAAWSLVKQTLAPTPSPIPWTT